MTARARRGSTRRTMPHAAWDAIGAAAARCSRAFVDFTHEFSIVLARGRDGADRQLSRRRTTSIATASSRRSTRPRPRRDRRAVDRGRGARRPRRRRARPCRRAGAANSSPTADGPVFNEMAPRVHNSGHWTIEGAVTSQFENHIRAICGLPLGGDRADRHGGRDGEPDRRRRPTLARAARRAAARISTSTASTRRGPAARWGMSRGCGGNDRRTGDHTRAATTLSAMPGSSDGSRASRGRNRLRIGSPQSLAFRHVIALRVDRHRLPVPLVATEIALSHRPSRLPDHAHLVSATARCERGVMDVGGSAQRLL